jgi:lipid-A-disaccharide synthase
MGLFGLLAEIPLLGIFLKRLAIKFISRKLSLVAIPNIKAGRKIVPELIGVLKETDVAARVESLLINIAEREKMHYELPIYMDKPAAKNIASFFQGMF